MLLTAMIGPEEANADELAAGHAALASGDWARARDLFESALAADESAAGWEGLGWSGWWLADEELTIRAREHAYRLYRAGGDDLGAGRVALWLAADFREYRGEEAVERGWLERAHRLLDPLPEASEHGWLMLMDADAALNVARDLGAVTAFAAGASEVGRRFGVPDLEAVGLGMEGLALVCRGEVEDGMRLLDESSAIATAENMRLPLSSGWALCCVLSACEGIGDFRRATQWCEAIRRFAERWGARQMLGICRTSYGRILATSGDWPAAEAELLAAVDDMEQARPGMAAPGLARLGELRARQGRYDDAQRLFERAGGRGLLGLGQLSLERGDPRAAADVAERILRRVAGSALLDRLPALELLARAQIRLEDLEAAESRVAEVERVAEVFGTSYVAGRAKLLRAELAGARRDHGGARRACEDAIDSFEAASAIYDLALARLELSRTLLELDREEAGRGEALAARAVFESLGARRDLERAEELLETGAGGGGPVLTDLTARELEILRLVARGMSDAEIAEELVLSPHTVHRHMANIRAKLRLPSRSAAVAYAANEGLL
jgi:ATP/maltotriose-dependent transcriptional regulator MalT